MKPKIVLRSAFDYDAAALSDATGLSCPEPTMAQQQFAEECDINEIVRRFGLSGQVPGNFVMPTYGDFEGIVDYQSALNALMAADESFFSLPAEIRKEFDNDPARFVEFCGDSANRERAIELGLVPPAPVVEPQLVKVVVDQPPAA